MKHNYFVIENAYPIGNGGGVVKTIDDLQRILPTSLGAIEIGSITMEPRDGNTGNTFFKGNGFTLNSIGLKNPGIKYYEENLPIMIRMIEDAGKIAVVNVAGFSKNEYAELTGLAFSAGSDFVVLNYGCPNVEGKEILSYNNSQLRDTTINVVRQNNSAAAEGRLGMKLSPIFKKSDMEDIASFLNLLYNSAGEHGGYIGFVTTINTVPNGYDSHEDGQDAITPNSGMGGIAGPAVLPIALGQVRQWRNILESEIKIIGIGGVSAGKDIIKMMKSGADLVQIVSSYYATEDPAIFQHIIGEYAELTN